MTDCVIRLLLRELQSTGNMAKKKKESGWVEVNGWELLYTDHRINENGEEEWYIHDWDMWQTYDQLEEEFFKALEEEKNSFLR